MHNCHWFVLTNYNKWVFGGFTKGIDSASLLSMPPLTVICQAGRTAIASAWLMPMAEISRSQVRMERRFCSEHRNYSSISSIGHSHPWVFQTASLSRRLVTKFLRVAQSASSHVRCTTCARNATSHAPRISRSLHRDCALSRLLRLDLVLLEYLYILIYFCFVRVGT